MQERWKRSGGSDGVRLGFVAEKPRRQKKKIIARCCVGGVFAMLIVM
jgi:hypothetical protein